MRVLIRKAKRELVLLDGTKICLNARISLGVEPIGAKQREGDGKTPEGIYQICLAKQQGKYGLSLGLSYPNAQDARRAYACGAIDQATFDAIQTAAFQERRPPWGSPLGGEIYLHEGDVTRDWTQGCIALAPQDMATLFAYRDQITQVEICP